MASGHVSFETSSGRALKRQEIKRCSVKYRLVSDQQDTVLADLVLTDLTIVIGNRDDSITYKEILLVDFLGAEIISTSCSDACWLEIHSFPAIKLASKKGRKLDVDAVLFPTTTAESIRTIVEWKNALHQECERAVRKTFVFEEEGMLDQDDIKH